jgi:vacuolar-type H+-ATPase subunit F/Vma7
MNKLPDLKEIPKSLAKRSDKLKEIKEQLIARIGVYQKKKKKLKDRRKEFQDESKTRLIVVVKADSLTNLQQHREQIKQKKEIYKAKKLDLFSCKGKFHSEINIFSDKNRAISTDDSWKASKRLGKRVP